MEIVVKLANPAKKSGGDKYEAVGDFVNFTVYIPQIISRAKTGHPADEMVVTITEK